MKRGFNLLLLAVAPMVALTTTSCYGVKTINFNSAYTYAVDHFDINSLDTVPVDYSFEMSKLGGDLNINIIDNIGVSSDFKIAFGLDNITVVVRDLYAYCMSSTVLSNIQNKYATVSSLVLESFTKIPLDLSYQLPNGGGMKVVLSTGGVTNNVVDLVRLVVSGLTTLSYLPEDTRNGIIDSLFESKENESEPIKPVPVKYTNIFNASTNSVVGEGEEEKVDFGVIVKEVTDWMAHGLSISVDPTSSSTNDVFEAVVACESHGYINFASSKLGGDVNIGILITTTDEFASYMPPLAGIDGRYTVTGNFGIDFSLTADFTN